MKRIGSSINANKHPYAKNDFRGDAFCAAKHDSIIHARNLTTKELMTPEQWDEFTFRRRYLGL